MASEAKKMNLREITESMAKRVFEGSDEIYSILDAIPFNLLYCGTDLVIKYANPASLETLEKIESLLPVTADKVVGSKIDIFHKDPRHQQKILANPRNLPLNSNIKLGEETLNLKIFPVMTEARFAGALVSWEVITEKLLGEKQNEN